MLFFLVRMGKGLLWRCSYSVAIEVFLGVLKERDTKGSSSLTFSISPFGSLWLSVLEPCSLLSILSAEITCLGRGLTDNDPKVLCFFNVDG